MIDEKEYQKLLPKIAKKIRLGREKLGLVQEDMVDYGFNYRFYQRLESGKHSPSLYTLYRLSKIFKIKLQDFFE
jgi:transcriptional regulator with XRE-family HTH domain